MSETQQKTLAMWRSCSPEELSAMVHLNTSLPDHLDSPPWRMPADHKDAVKINRLLEQSLVYQASTVPSAAEQFPALKKSLLSNAALEVSILLRNYLNRLDVEAEVISGLFKGPRGNAFPQVFLDISGHTIENSYTHLEEGWTPERNMEVFVERFSQRKQLTNYVRESPSDTKLAIIGKELLGEKFDQDGIDYLGIVCNTEMNQDKHLAMQISKPLVNPGVLLYDLLMRNFVKEAFGIDVDPVYEEMTGACWSCGLAGGELKTCTGCKAGKYCDKKCLQEDWMKMHKLMHKVCKKKETK
eukprot:GFUD01016795.1.p1 GENE.GFUD01016795.1~~GFUD01016795.1.p1  ORF type:complete len:299 (-),score=86.37 GFUD01016795.1:8-904(-)